MRQLKTLNFGVINQLMLTESLISSVNSGANDGAAAEMADERERGTKSGRIESVVRGKCGSEKGCVPTWTTHKDERRQTGRPWGLPTYLQGDS